MHNFFTEEINKIALRSNNDKRTQSNDSIESNAFGTNKDLICKCNKQYNKTIQKMGNSDDATKENIKDNNLN